MLRFLKKLTIRAQMLLLAASTGLIMLVIILLIYFLVSGIVSRYNGEYTDNMMYQIKNTVANNCKQAQRVLTGVAFNRTVQSYIVSDDAITKYLMFKDIDNNMIGLASTYEGIVDIALLDRNGNRVYFLHGENEELKSVLREMPAHDNEYYSEVRTLQYQTQSVQCFIIATPIKSILTDSSVTGVIGMAAIVIDADNLSMGVSKDANSTKTLFYLLDRNNTVYSSNQPADGDSRTDAYLKYADMAPGVYNTTIDGINYVITKEDIAAFGGKLISVVPEQELLRDVVWTRQIAIALFFVALGLLSIPFMVIMNNIVNPLNRFVKFFSSVKANKLGGLKQRLNVEGYREMVIMVREFNGLLDEIDSLTQKLVQTNSRLYETELEKKKAELSYLKSQINPHFLYNTLETVKGSAIDEGAHKTSGMAKALAQIFRYSVKGADTVTLRDEVEIIRHYLFIQQIRFNGRISGQYEFTEEALACRIPPMILQPIVENAVFHGLEMKLGEGRIRLTGSVKETGELVIVIGDDGLGMGEDTLRQIQAGLHGAGAAGGRAEGNEAIGIKNVDNRIKLIYGSAYGLAIASTLGSGTEVTIRIPARSL